MTAGTPLTPSRTGSTLLAAAGLLAIAAAIALLPLRQVVLAAGAVTAVLLVLRWPWLILLPLAALLPVTSGIRIGPASITDLLLAAAVGLWFVDGARRRTLTLRGSPVITLVALYVIVLIASAWGAANFGEAAREVIKWVELLVLLLVAPALLTREQAPWVAASAVSKAASRPFGKAWTRVPARLPSVRSMRFKRRRTSLPRVSSSAALAVAVSMTSIRNRKTCCGSGVVEYSEMVRSELLNMVTPR